MPKSRSFRELKSNIELALTDLEALTNHVTDRDTEWWPFAFLRPEKEQPLSTFRVAALSVLYGLPTGLLMVLMDRVSVHEITADKAGAFVLCVCVGFFTLYRFTFAYFWNRRAERFEKLRVRREAWRAKSAD
jgi:hypothetical protein